jgi:pyruvate kinase
MTRSTKIVATLGPASSDPAVLERLLRAGVDVVRLNFSHGKAQDHIDRARLVRETAERVGKPVALMADLQGPKIRVGKFDEGKVMLVPGAPFTLDAARTEPGNVDIVGLDYKELPRDVRPGDQLLLNDGLLVLIVDSVRGEQVHTIVKIGGELSNNKGINKLGGGLTAPALTAKDMEDIRTAASFQCDFLAVSFPKNATDMEMARQLANVAGEPYRHKPAMIAKIERTEAIPNLEAILRASDGIMVARGDLAVEVGAAAVPALQKKMIRMAREMDKIAITATQMMESMIVNPVPTRAEVSDVANAVLDGTDAVMLSAETAAGKYPVETVEQMALIALEAERAEEIKLDADFMNKRFGRIDQSIAMGALFTAHHLGCKAIIALTESGSTALWMSHDAVPQRAAGDDAAAHRPRPGAGRCGTGSGRARRAAPGRHLRDHLRRADGLPGWHQHAESLPGGLTQATTGTGTGTVCRTLPIMAATRGAMFTGTSCSSGCWLPKTRNSSSVNPWPMSARPSKSSSTRRNCVSRADTRRAWARDSRPACSCVISFNGTTVRSKP